MYSNRHDDTSSAAAPILLGLLFGLICLCLIIGALVVVVQICRRKAKRTQTDRIDDVHTIQRADTITAGAIDFQTQDMIDTIPTATETGYELEPPLPIVQAKLTLPPVITEEMESLPVAAAQFV